MKIKTFLKTKEFKIKLTISIILLVLFSLSFLFAKNFNTKLGLTAVFSKNEVSTTLLDNADYKVHYLDVGQGACSIIELPDGKIMIIDGGSDRNGEKICNFLKERNVDKIDYLIATHADSDHIGGLNYIFDDFEIVNIFRPMQIAGTIIEEIDSNGHKSSYFEVYENEDLKFAYEYLGSSRFVEVSSKRYRNFIENIYKETYVDDGEIKKSNVCVFYDGLEIIGKNYVITFYAPLISDLEINLSSLSNTNGYLTKIYSNDSSNNSSSILLLNICGDKFFFSGDASNVRSENDNIIKFEESDFLNSLTEEDKIELSNVDVYLVAHHGSKNSTGEDLLALIKPDFAVISIGINSYGHPNQEVIDRLNFSNCLETDGLLTTKDRGTISFINIDGKIVYVSSIKYENINKVFQFEIFIIIIYIIAQIFVLNIRFHNKNDLTC